MLRFFSVSSHVTLVPTLQRGNEKKINQGGSAHWPPLKGKKKKGLSIPGETHHAETEIEVPADRPVPACRR